MEKEKSDLETKNISNDYATELFRLTDKELKILESFDSTDICIAAYSPYNYGEDFIFTYFNQAAEKAEGISKENILGKKLTEVFPGVDEFGLLNVFRYVLDTGEGQHHHLALYKDNRHSGWRENYVTRFPSGTIVTMYFNQNSVIDVLNESKEKSEIIERFLENIQTYVCIFNEEGKIKFANKALLDDLGYTLSEVKKMKVFDLRKFDKEINLKEYLKNLQYKDVIDCNAPYVSKAGEIIWVKSKVYKIKLFGENNYASFSQNINYEIETEQILQLQSAALRATVDGIVITDKKGDILWVNPAFTKLTGYTKQEVLRKNPRILKSGVHSKEFYKDLWETILSGKVWKGKIKNKRKDGSIYVEEMSITPILDENERIINFIAIKHDVTAEEEAFRELKISEEKFKVITQNAIEAIITMDENGKITMWNPSATKMFGYTEEEAIGKDLHLLIVPEKYRDAARRGLDRFFKTGEGQAIGRTIELSGLKKSKEEFPLELSLSKVQIKDQWNAIGIIRDISKRKSYEMMLRDKEKRFEDLIRLATVGIYRFDRKGKIIMINPALVRILGYTDEKEVLELNEESIFPNLEARNRMLLWLEQGKKIYGYDTQWRRKNGTIAEMQESAWQIYDLEGNFVYYEAIVEDMTEYNQFMQMLQESENKYRTLLDKLNDAVYLLVDNKFELVNNKFLDLLEIEKEDLQSKDFKLFDYIAPESREKVLERQRKLKNHEKVDGVYQFKLITKTGKKKVVEASVGYINYKGKIATQGVLRDITEKIRLETEIRHAQKMEAIGTLAAGIAHEINTPSQYVNDNLTFMQSIFGEVKNVLFLAKEIADGKKDVSELQNAIDNIDLDFLVDEIPNAINQSIEGVQRIAKIVGAMREFSHERPNEFVRVDLKKLIDNTLIISKNAWKYVADVETNYDENLPPVKCLQSDMNQVIVNMVVNAAHAIEDKFKDSGKKGLISIETQKEDDFVKISIKDNGTGIPKEIMDRIFEPFFTTKEVGKGTGQGLAIVYDIIVNKHSGQLDLNSEVGVGTEFIIRIPLDPEQTGNNDGNKK